MIKDIIDISIKLSSVMRYSQTKLVNPESVLEHQGFVVFASYAIASRLNELGEGYHLGKVLVGAAIHDVDEIGTGDIPRPTKYSTPEVKSMLDQLAEMSVGNLGNESGLEFLYEDWSASKSGREGAIVALCDMLSVLMKVYQEVVMFSNLTIIDHADGMDGMIEKRFLALRKTLCMEESEEVVADMLRSTLKIWASIKTKEITLGV